MLNLPEEFLERMQKLLGEEYEIFLQTYEDARKFGLRVNTLKISVEEFKKQVPFHLTEIPWIDNGFYYEKEDYAARHPFYYAGMFYLQEPSAMTPANILPVTPGEHVLDLCAAPGGKATALAAKLQGEGLLVANDISASRAKALLKNLEVFGVKNAFVTNAAPAKLAEQFQESFDKILVDAPCSGEGMFRKDLANARAWSMDKVEECAKIQREITQQAVKMLRPGGLMLYSTCTFAPEENEGTIAYLLETCPDMELIEMPVYEGFSQGMPELLKRFGEEKDCIVSGETWKVLHQAGVFSADDAMKEHLTGQDDAGQNSMEQNFSEEKWEILRRCVRIFPHKMDGEGHFLALLKKKGELSGIHKKHMRKSGKPSKEEEKVLREFLKDVSMECEMERIEVRKEQVYFVPCPPEIKGGIPFLRNGLYLGELKKGRFEPSQSFAMALCGPAGKKTEYSSVVDLDYSDERVRRYLCGETIDVDDVPVKSPKGWQLVCVNGFPLGWGKLVNGTLKNKYHPGWRMQV